MGRNEKISKEEVFEILGDGEWHRYSKLVAKTGVGRETIKKKVGKLLDDGFCIINGPAGIKLIDKDDVTEETAGEILAMIPWLIGMVGAMAARAVPIKSIMPAVRKCLPKTTEERKYLRSVMVRITHLIDWQEIEQIENEA